MRNIKSVGYMLIIFISLFAFNKISAYKSYNIGDEVTYNDIKFYVIKNSSSDEESVTMLKAEPLTVDEVNLYGGVGTSNNHVNRYTSGTAYNRNGYGYVEYHTSETCQRGCNIHYEDSDIKFIVDAWALEEFNQDELLTDSTGYGARLITVEDLNALGYNDSTVPNENVPTWVYSYITSPSDYYCYWTMSFAYRSIRYINLYGALGFDNNPGGYVRPVITLKKSAIEKEEMIIDDNTEKNNTKQNEKNNTKQNEKNNTKQNEKNNTKQNENENITNERKDIVDIVKVPNTMQKVSIVFILLGVTLVSISTIILIKNRNMIKK